jgi:hypothetical protein
MSNLRSAIITLSSPAFEALQDSADELALVSAPAIQIGAYNQVFLEVTVDS